MNYKEAMEYIEGVGTRGIVPGLESIRALCRELGNPQDSLQFIHIAGTNGKGSVLAYLSTVLKEAGYRVGRYCSPTIYDYRERFCIGNRMISQKELGNCMETVKEACDRMTANGLPHPTAFEVETALAFWYFAKQKCDLVVLETGMGGLLDATNLVTTTLVSVITSVGMDHMQFLGKTIEEIAANKAGILKPGAKAITMKQDERVLKVLEQKAGEVGTNLILTDSKTVKGYKHSLQKQSFDYREYKKLEIGLLGKFQVDNAVLAIETCRLLGELGYPVSEKAIRRGLAGTVWDGRFTLLSKNPVFLADGAHNEDAARKLADTIEFYFTNKRIIYIMGMLKDKECEKVIALTHRFAEHIITLTPPENQRALPGVELAHMVYAVHPAVTTADSIEEAVELAKLLAGKDGIIIAFGSLSYLGRLMQHVRALNPKKK